MSSIHIYCMPGMAASPKIFEFLVLPKPFEIHLLSWIPPNKNESLVSYAKRMCENISHKNPVLLGVSFGGVLVQEMAKHISVRNIVIVSSVKNKKELPFSMKMSKKTNIHKLLPVQWINNIDNLVLFVFGQGIKRRLELYQRYLSVRDPDYLHWAINSMVHWNQINTPENIFHIHGVSDNVFPLKNLSKPLVKIKGGHAVILTQADWLSNELPKLLRKK